MRGEALHDAPESGVVKAVGVSMVNTEGVPLDFAGDAHADDCVCDMCTRD